MSQRGRRADRGERGLGDEARRQDAAGRHRRPTQAAEPVAKARPEGRRDPSVGGAVGGAAAGAAGHDATSSGTSAKISRVKPVSTRRLHAPVRTSTTAAASFGTNVSVDSWIWVADCSTESARPTARVVTRIGPASLVAVSRAPATMWMTWSATSPPSAIAAEQRGHDEGPAVDEDEQQQLERQRDEGGRQHDHAERHENRADDDVDHEERHEDDEADDESPPQLAQHEGGDERAQVGGVPVLG